MASVLKVCKKHGECNHFYAKSEDRYRCTKCSSEKVSKRRKALKQMAVDYLGGNCQACGYNRCIDALEFHHQNPAEKDFSISSGGLTRSFDKIKSELDKCILLCANCHREVHSC